MSLRIWLIILLYAAFSILWIAIADYLISLTLEDPVLRQRAYLAKELILIAISGMMFYIFLKLERGNSHAKMSDAGSRFGRFRLNRLMLMFFSLAMIVPLVGIGIVKVYSPQVERGAYADLQTIVDLKTEQIELWLEERNGDALALAESHALIERVSSLVRNGDPNVARSIRRRLEAVRKAYSYESVLLLNPRGEPLLALGKEQKLPRVTRALISSASESPIQSTGFFRDEHGAPRLDMVVALMPEGSSNEPAAFVVLCADLQQFLLPLIEKWPGNSPSAETLLVNPHGSTVRHLNRRRHTPEATASQRSATESQIPLPTSFAEPTGTVHGVDYRGEPVFASFRTISGTDWWLYAKIDQREAFMQLWTLVFWISVVILIAIAAVSLVLLQLWRQQQRAHELALVVRTAEQDRLLKYFYELPFIGMTITARDFKRWLRFNDQLCQMLGYSHEELATKTWVELTHPDDIRKDMPQFERVLGGESEGYVINKRFIRKDGSVMLANIDIKCVRANDGSVDYFVAMIRDITEQEQRKREILAAQSDLRATLDALPDLLVELDLEGCCHAYHSARTGLPAARIANPIGRKVSEIMDPDTSEIILSALLEAQDKGLSVGKQVKLALPADEGYLWFELSVSRKKLDTDPEPRFIVLARDITERKASEQHILNLAHYDTLTGLPNRALLADRMKVAINRAARESARLAVLFADLDRFKAINDSLGHDVGDQLLKAAAERMQRTVRGVDTVSRVGGDEFVVLLSEIETAEDAARVAEKLISALSQPYHIGEHELLLTASIGICLYPDNGSEPGILLRNADASMYSAKETGRNRYQFYSEDMTVRAIERLSLENDLRSAVERRELFLVYQPQIEIDTGRIMGAEVLMRWQHPVRGLITPMRFIPVAEDTGLILGLGEWALYESCRQAQAWRERGQGDVCISVNVSAVQFRQSDFVTLVARILQESGLPPVNLELELTESVILQGVEPALQKFRELNSLGVKVAIDDFGTGYSSLSCLRQFTVDRLKIDQSFIRDLPGDPDAEAIAAAIVAMGLRLGLRIIAEGVETEAQASFLQRICCNEGQGYLYAWPMTAAGFEAWVREWPHPDRLRAACDKKL